MPITNRFFIPALAVCLLAACGSEEKPDSLEPQLFADAATGISRTQATIRGHISLSGQTAMPALYFVYGRNGEAGVETEPLTVRNDSVEWTMSGLKPQTVYQYCLVGSNGRVTLRSTMGEFTTQSNDKPAVETPEAYSHSPHSVIVGFRITDNGGEPVTAAGCYVTETATGQTRKSEADTAQIDHGKVVLRIGSLKGNTQYQLKAYAANTVGEVQSDVTVYTTSDGVVLTTAGQLRLLLGDEWSDYEKLTLSGPMNGDDLRLLRMMAGRDTEGKATPGKLSVIDLSEVNITEGGQSYDGSHFAGNGVVGQGLFANCGQLKDVVLPDAAVTVDKDVFANCTSLTSITMPAAVTRIVPSGGCTALEAIMVSGANKHFKSIDGVLLNSEGTKIIWYPIAKKGAYTLPSTLEEIGDYAFQDCKLSAVTLPAGLTRLGKAVFYASSLQTATLSPDLETIPRATFQKCKQLNTVYLGKATALITEYVFDGCPLRDLYIDAEEPPLCYKTAFGASEGEALKNCTLHVPAGSARYYRAKEMWAKAAKIVER